MLKLYPDQLRTHLNKELSPVYLLIGNDLLLLQESQEVIHLAAKKQGFEEQSVFHLDRNTNWQEIFYLCQSRGLFSSRYILKILLPEDGPNVSLNEKLSILINLLHRDLLLIIQGNNLTRLQKNATWFNQLELASNRSVLVICQTPEQDSLFYWVTARAKQNNLQLEDTACQLLCHYYEGNLPALVQALDKLTLLWPDQKLSFVQVEQVVNDAACFTPFHWVNSVISADSKRALHILKQLRLEGNEPVILIRALQREILLLLILKRQSLYAPLCKILDQFHVWKSRRAMMIKAIKCSNQNQLRQAIQLITRIELILKRNSKWSVVWLELESASFLFCCDKCYRK